MATVTVVRFRSMFAGLRTSHKKQKAAGYLRMHIARFNNADPDTVKIDKRVNEYIMSNIVKGGGEIKLNIVKSAGKVEVKLAEDTRPKVATNIKPVSGKPGAAPAKSAAPAPAAAKSAAPKDAKPAKPAGPSTPSKEAAAKETQPSGQKKPEQEKR